MGRKLLPGLKQKENGKYQFRWTDAAGERQKRTLSHDRESAEKCAREILRLRDLEAQGLTSHVQQSTSLARLVEQYLDDLKARVSPRHFDNTKSALEQLQGILRCGTVASLTVPKLLAARAQLVKVSKRQSNRTVNKKMGHLRAALSWGVKGGVIASNPCERIERLPEGGKAAVKVRRYLTREEARLLVATARSDDLACARTHGRSRIPQTPLITVLMGTGFRVGEAMALRWRNLTSSDGRARLEVETSKNGYPRTNPISDELFDELRELRSRSGAVLGHLPSQDDHILLTPRGVAWASRSNADNAIRWLDRVITNSGLEKVDAKGTSIDFHAMRHSYCNWLAEAGVDVGVAANLMGHRDINLTRTIYQDLRRSDRPRDDAVDRLPTLGGDSSATEDVG